MDENLDPKQQVMVAWEAECCLECMETIMPSSSTLSDVGGTELDISNQGDHVFSQMAKNSSRKSGLAEKV